jgi:hypothetical protein
MMISQHEASMFTTHPIEQGAELMSPEEEIKEVSSQLSIIRKRHDS